MHREILTALPANDRELFIWRRPGKVILSLTELLELHGKLTLLDLVLREGLQVSSEAELEANPDEPLGRIVLIPLNGITVVHGELVVEVVVTLTDGNERSDEVITGSVLVVEGGLTEPVGQGVNAEGRLVEASVLFVYECNKGKRTW